jgi:ribosomal protein L11 methyltransferase
VLATDIDADAVRVARENTELNGVGPLIEVAKANGLAAPAIRSRAPFDLVVANILLGPLQRLASPLTKTIAPGGHLVLSGLLTAQANAALSAYRALPLERRIEIDGWTTLILKRRRRARSVVAPAGKRP